MNACWSRVPGVACCLGDELADDPEGGAAGGVAGWPGPFGWRGLWTRGRLAEELAGGEDAGYCPPRRLPRARSSRAGSGAGNAACPRECGAAGQAGDRGAAAAAGFAFAGAALVLAGAVRPDADWRLPLSTKPAMPCSASGAAEEWALRVKPGSESAPMVSRTPPE